MSHHATCGTCLFNKAAQCTNEASRYHGAPLKSWNTCSQHAAPMPTTAELLARLVVCTAALSHFADKVGGEYRDYYADRARQCRKWGADIREGQAADMEYIVGGLQEFEQIAL